MLSGDLVHGMRGVGKLHASANERPAILTRETKSLVEAFKETLDPIRRPGRACFDKTRNPLARIPLCCVYRLPDSEPGRRGRIP
jgi:hypothetical protein